jgi:hypothetical protein
VLEVEYVCEVHAHGGNKYVRSVSMKGMNSVFCRNNKSEVGLA